MRISDWSSDVCSSDLAAARRDHRHRGRHDHTGGYGLMELVLSIAIGILAASGVWLLLRPRTFQVIIALTLISYAVNLFIFSIGGLRTGAVPVLKQAAGDNGPSTNPLPLATARAAQPTGMEEG